MQFEILINFKCSHLFSIRVENTIDESPSKLSNMDHMKFVDAMVYDPVLDTYRLSQSALTRQELDARDSSTRNLTFF